MRAVLISTALSLILASSAVSPALAQGVEPPAALPEASPDMAPGPEDPPMVLPAPDEDLEESPDAFGSEPLPDGDAQEAAVTDDDPATPERTIDGLFAELRKEPDEGKARLIASRIERQWRRSGSATIDLLMLRAAKAMSEEDSAAARDLLDQALVLAPDYAEAWNRRATLSFTTDDWGKSLADIEQTLLREPRHWGALMGLATILERTGHKDKALEAYMQVLSVYPSLKSAQDAAGRLSDELVGPLL
ncbi:tetratricopeptide repeat protein [Aurantimonas aggregata]|uniref:Tetratricopeptide repeat protein n=1 Tax=Aurantimonas aggregata TaxID=2047720 RepID=A0A6L9MH15_9HYPH|nr:tetratricopeptide repeat protein [Aurantimonas aggregata]NDV87143.1 tetratricopeptide repeat protein [Aurantimonas aggregata]